MKITPWISLGPQSFFSRNLICESNIPEISKLSFISQKGTISVLASGVTIFHFDGWKTAEIAGRQFKSKIIRAGVEALVSDEYVIELTTDFGKKENAARIEVACTRNPNERYVLERKSALLTHVFIRSVGEACDAELMVACLAYQWATAECDRIT